MRAPHNAEGHLPGLGESPVGLRVGGLLALSGVAGVDRSYRTAVPDFEWLTAALSERMLARTFKYQRRSRRAYSEHRSHSLARRAPSGVRDDKPASWNARPALTRPQRPPEQIGRALKALSHAKIAIDRHKFKDKKGVRYICGIKFNDAGNAHWQNKIDEISAPNYGRNSDLARVSDSIAKVSSVIPKGENWWDHPLVVKLRNNEAKIKAKTKTRRARLCFGDR